MFDILFGSMYANGKSTICLTANTKMSLVYIKSDVAIDRKPATACWLACILDDTITVSNIEPQTVINSNLSILFNQG